MLSKPIVNPSINLSLTLKVLRKIIAVNLELTKKLGFILENPAL